MKRFDARNGHLSKRIVHITGLLTNEYTIRQYLVLNLRLVQHRDTPVRVTIHHHPLTSN